jgi:hypothetical protein
MTSSSNNSNRRFLRASCKTARSITASFLAALFVLVVSLQPAAAQTPTVTTDKEDYGPTEIPIISGADFAPNTSLDVIVLTPKELQKGKNLYFCKYSGILLVSNN